jgi:hypothetical protein
MAGFACGVKLTAVPMLLLPLPVALVVIAVARHEAIGSALRAAVVFGAVGAAVFAPWVVRNVAWTGNPVFPEAQSVFGRAHFTETQSARWTAAHSPRADQRSVSARLAAAWDQIGHDARFGYALLPLALISVALARRRPETWLLLGMLAIFAIIWLGFTHLQSRFFVLAIPVAAVLVSQLRERAATAAGVVLCVLMSVIGTAAVHERLTVYLHEKQLASLLGFQEISALMTPEIIKDVPADAPLALAGDAKAFCYDRPVARLRYRTVFDVADGANAIDAWLGGTHQPGEFVLVDPNELLRFRRTYLGLPEVPRDVATAPRPYLLNDPHP